MLDHLKKQIADSPKPIMVAQLQDELLDKFYCELDIAQYCRAKVFFSDRRIAMIAEDMGYRLEKRVGCDTGKVKIYGKDDD